MKEIHEMPDVPVIYADGSIRVDTNGTVRILLYTHRALAPGERDHVATIVMTREAFMQTLADAQDQMPEAAMRLLRRAN